MAKKKAKARAKKKVSRTGVRVTLALEPRAHRVFVAAGGGQGKSSYVSAVLRQRERQWRQALETLRGDYMPAGKWEDEAIVRHLEDSEYAWQSGDVCTGEDTTARVTEVELSALLVLCGEWYAGNEALREALGAQL